MNLKELGENLGMDEEEFLEIMELFIDTSTTDFNKLQSAIDEKNSQKVAEAAHSIKGASANLGFKEVQEATKNLEEKGRNNHLEGITELAQILKKELDEVEKLVHNLL